MELKSLLKNGFVGLLLVAFMASCSTSNDVVSSNRIQKRKYSKGFHLNIGKKDKNNTVAMSVKSERSTAGAKVNGKSPAEKIEKKIQEETVAANTKSTKVETKRSNKLKVVSSFSTDMEESTTETTDMTAPAKENKKSKKSSKKKSNSSSAPTWLVWVLAVFLPFVAVGLVTDWDVKLTLIALGLTLLGWLPGVIMALIVVNNHI